MIYVGSFFLIYGLSSKYFDELARGANVLKENKAFVIGLLVISLYIALRFVPH